ncbi:LysE family translocator [Marinomonas piezotolerans]|uniref:LysE family translocator n=1 Tax=Marinomonas piezotolerans TaxID=2213058 RepID=A0A370UC24_9GAMM|nr:LysE family translocator [Marinomonas piezotolerans]RDL45301.1 LysE family translocator [Marinomonas piezotolerans]
MIEQFIPQTFFVLALAHWLALLSPGQDFVLLITQTLRFGHQRSRYAVIGIALGNLLYIALVIVVGATLREYPMIFNVIQWLGVVYLAWIGVNLLRAQPALMEVTVTRTRLSNRWHTFFLGLGSAVLNPKNALFYLSLMSSILGEQATVLQQTVAGVWMFLVVLVWDWVLVLWIAQPAFRQRVQRYLHWLERVCGGIFIGLAAVLAVWR